VRGAAASFFDDAEALAKINRGLRFSGDFATTGVKELLSMGAVVLGFQIRLFTNKKAAHVA